ncbi:unnamed protein product, partial [Rotaria sordida]
HYHQISSKLAVCLIRSIQASTETIADNDVILNNNQQSTSINTTVADEIGIVPYKRSYSTTLNNENPNLLKKFIRYIKNIPCDCFCPVNLYRHIQNYRKVDSQDEKDYNSNYNV